MPSPETKIDPTRPERFIAEFRSDRVVVIEWLPRGEPKTGTELVARASRFKSFSDRFELHTCNSKSEVCNALDEARMDIPRRGVPIVHVEAHGAVGPNGGFGCGDELLTWGEIRPALSRLNVASRFNLLAVGASCFGDGLLYAAAQSAEASPFIACIGFSTSVMTSSILDSMVEFYRNIFVYRKNVEDAVEDAQRELRAVGESLRFMTVRSLVILAIQATVKELGGMDAAGFIACEWLVASQLGYDVFPENRQRFPINLPEVIARAH